MIKLSDLETLLLIEDPRVASLQEVYAWYMRTKEMYSNSSNNYMNPFRLKSFERYLRDYYKERSNSMISLEGLDKWELVGDCIRPLKN